jgi:SAM-dependent methyltransferase
MKTNFNGHPRAITLSLIAAATLLAGGAPAQQIVEPTVGQPGKDAVWVPTSAEMVEKMLDMAQVTPQDLVVDLGSGDGRTVIAAAKRGARALGVEYNNDLVELSRLRAREAGVADRATFVQGDMFEADISRATVLALFLLPDNLERLRDKFLALPPGTRIVLNTLDIPEWEPDDREVLVGNCVSWCTSLLHIVPAQVAGVWQLPFGELTLTQRFQMVSGTLSSAGRATPLTSVRVRGDRITFAVADVEYAGRVKGDRIEGNTGAGGTAKSWTATRRR